MKSLTVFTEAYFKALDDFTIEFFKRRIRRDLCEIKLFYDEFDAAAVARFLEWVCFQENVVLKHSAKIAAVVKKAIPPAIADENVRLLREYARENKTLHVEGYIKFRMAAYSDYLNRMLYRIAKKLMIM